MNNINDEVKKLSEENKKELNFLYEELNKIKNELTVGVCE